MRIFYLDAEDDDEDDDDEIETTTQDVTSEDMLNVYLELFFSKMLRNFTNVMKLRGSCQKMK